MVFKRFQVSPNKKVEAVAKKPRPEKTKKRENPVYQTRSQINKKHQSLSSKPVLKKTKRKGVTPAPPVSGRKTVNQRPAGRKAGQAATGNLPAHEGVKTRSLSRLQAARKAAQTASGNSASRRKKNNSVNRRAAARKAAQVAPGNPPAPEGGMKLRSLRQRPAGRKAAQSATGNSSGSIRLRNRSVRRNPAAQQAAPVAGAAVTSNNVTNRRGRRRVNNPTVEQAGPAGRPLVPQTRGERRRKEVSLQESRVFTRSRKLKA